MTDLLPSAHYELWVTATNTTGISPASEKALYMTGNTRFILQKNILSVDSSLDKISDEFTK